MVHDAEPHPGDPGLWWDWRLARELDAAESAIAFSDSVAAGIHRRRPGLRVHRLTLGSLLTLGGPVAASDRAVDEPYFVNLGRLRAYKGLDLLRDAWRLFQPRFPKARLLVAGEGDAEALAPGLTALPGVAVQARWLGEADMARLLATADALVLPYREASQSGVAPLAHGFGVPVVATPVGGLTEQLRDGVDGILARAVTAEALAEAMAELCDPARRAALAQGARDTGRRRNDWDAIVGQLLQALERPAS
jgi:glycosyltransferase involved in cell wall biosynthesis